VHDILLQGSSYRALILLNPLFFWIGVAVEPSNRGNNRTVVPLASPLGVLCDDKSVSRANKDTGE